MKIYKIYIAAFAIGLCGGCTDLDETSYDKVLADSYGKSPSEIETIVAGAYTSLRGPDYNYPTEWIWYLGETSSDEAIIPTRGKDWDDLGVHREIQTHTWKTSNDIILKSWQYLYSGISKVNQIISYVEKTSLPENDKKNITAELRGVRAFYYWWLCDLYGNVPLQIDFDDKTPKANSTRKEVYEFIESELLDIIDLLPVTGYGKFTQNAGNTLLARLYLNAGVYSGTPQWEKCIAACDKVKGVVLEKDFFNNFKVDNETSTENIFVIPYDEDLTVGNYQIYLSLHYSSGATSVGVGNGVNGMCAEPGVYSMFDPLDSRINSMIIGPQISEVTGAVMVDYTEAIVNWKEAQPNEGVRYWKYPISINQKWERSNDYVLMRYSEVLLMKAEALMRLNQNALARPLIEMVRLRAGKDLTTPATVDLDYLYKELLFEFLWENHRRTDNIRFGKFGTSGIDVTLNDKNLEIMPIPAKVLELNSKLKQNPGYN